jgi:hypothetical protein
LNNLSFFFSFFSFFFISFLFFIFFRVQSHARTREKLIAELAEMHVELERTTVLLDDLRLHNRKSSEEHAREIEVLRSDLAAAQETYESLASVRADLNKTCGEVDMLQVSGCSEIKIIKNFL